MRLGLFLAAMLALPATTASAEAPKVAQKIDSGFWRILVKPKARWVLKDSMPPGTGPDKKRKQGKLIIETYDVRKVGTADVARLRWTAIDSYGTKSDWGNSDSGRYTQVAVTSAGMYILSADMDDAAVAEALKKKPSRSDPPKPYKGTKQNDGRYLKIENDQVCMGFEPLPDAPECDSICQGEVCYTATRGVVSVSGVYSPDEVEYNQ